MADIEEHRKIATVIMEEAQTLLDSAGSEQDFVKYIQEITNICQTTLSQRKPQEPESWVKKSLNQMKQH